MFLLIAFIVGVLLLSLTSCATDRGSPDPPPAQRLMPPIVFIHGFKGSVLSDSQGSVRWLNWQQAFGLSSSDLSLPLHWNGEVQQRDELIARAPLRAVAWQDVYSPLLNWASTSGQVFRAFAYDWRRDNLENTAEFVKFLEKVSRENGEARIQVVAHSMGGLITFVALNRRPDLFHSVLFAGVRFRPGCQFFGGHARGHRNRPKQAHPEPAGTVYVCIHILPVPLEYARFGAGGEERGRYLARLVFSGRLGASQAGVVTLPPKTSPS